MRPINLVLAQHIEASGGSLAGRLRHEFRNVAVAQSAAEIRSNIARFRAPLALVDLEFISLPELQQLCQEFPATSFIAIHRLADEEMWSEALAAGAVDCCAANDLHGILMAADRYVVRTYAVAA